METSSQGKKVYHLLGADGKIYDSEVPGTLGGNCKDKIYGSLCCSSANRALPYGYAEIRVFFATEEDAIANGYRPCGNCMRKAYQEWKAGKPGDAGYRWLVGPKEN